MSSMEEWLRVQAERAQARVVVGRSGLSSTPVRYFSVQRVTTSDVISVLTTTVVDGPGDVHPAELEARRKDLRDAQYTSPLRHPALLQMEERERQNKALWREADIFLSKLARQRAQRIRLETDAALKIQSMFRGFRWRKFIAKEKRKRRVRMRMRNRVKFMTKANNMVIVEREKKARVLEAKRRAVRSIQCMARSYFARRAAAKERQMLQEEVLVSLATRIQCMVRRRLARRAGKKARMRARQDAALCAARLIQRVFRGHVGRRRAWARRYGLQRAASTIIQRAFRRVMILRNMDKERSRRASEAMNTGAIGVQRLYRGKLGRRRVALMRNREHELLRHAGALCVQRVYRGHLGRRMWRDRRWRRLEDERMRVATHFIRLWRGFLGRRRFADERDRQNSDVFTQARLGNHKKVKDLMAGFGTDQVYTVNSMDANGNTVLLVAARWGHKKIVRHCLRIKMQIDHVNDRRETAVELAVRHGHADVAEYLISKEASLSFFGRTLLHDAAARGMVATARALIAQNVPIGERDDAGDTPLHEAARNGQYAALELLVDRGADVNAANAAGWTPLHAAAERGHHDVVQKLVDLGADASVKDPQGRTAWRVALINKHERCAVILRAVWAEALGAEADLVAEAEATQDDKDAVFQHAVTNEAAGVAAILDRGLPVDFADLNGTTVLMAAAAAGSMDVVKLCLRKGAHVGRANKEGRTALHVSCAHQQVALYLLANGAEAGALDGKDRSALHEAAAAGWIMSQAVEREGLDVTMMDADGRTPLMEAARNGRTQTAKELLALGARVNAPDYRGQTALHFAACCPDGIGVVNLLLARGGGVNHADHQGRTPLHKAAAMGQTDVCAALLEGGANANHKDGKGITPVRAAVDQDRDQVVTLLLQYGGSATEPDATGHTPLYSALRHRNAAATASLLQHGGDLMETYRDGSTPLHVCAASGFREGVQLCLGATEMGEFLLSKTNRRGDIAFLAGCRSGRGGEALRALQAAGSAVPANAVHVAAAAPKKAALQFLLSLPSTDVNAKDASGMTPLHHAGRKGRVANMRLIIAAGGAESEATPKGESVLDLAKDHDAAVEFLLGDRGPPTADEEGSDEEDETTKIVTEEDRVAFALGLLS